jgi:transposase InsO family protein
MKTGRPPKGSGLVERLEASPGAKERAKVIIGTLQEELTVREACEQLGISEARFHQLRDRFLLGGMKGLEPRLGGRPRQGDPEAELRQMELEERITQLEKELKAAELRAQIALVMPHLLKEPGRSEKKDGPEKKGEGDGQEPKRRAEAAVRQRAVVFVQENGVTLPEGGSLLHLSAATLREWQRQEKRGALGPNLLGRPGYGCSRRTIRDIRDLFWEVGPEVSVEYLRERMWWVPRAIIERVIRACKREFKRGQLARLQMLWWEKAGRSWSCDWTDPEAPIDGAERKVFVLRDLASGKNLQSLPSSRQSALLATRILEHQFIIHGAPLVVKTDGGPEFKAVEFTELLKQYGVAHLMSPGHYPPYNGAIEAGIGSLKTHTWYEAARKGRVGYWTCDDVEAGRLKANETSRPWGPGGPSPDLMWMARNMVSDQERMTFNEVLAEKRAVYAKLIDKDGLTAKAIERLAIAKSLEKCGYLVITRRRVSLGVSS